ncbi:MFS transporter [Paenibacillus sp. NAIST15-1]|uniref:MFS transporter n=1 Tax=Paenibacillus sp. NAIST15-1 TaxID=1605994 RepID=UPI001D126A4A|nr:MFS transporter [Paenibacillus sp. NAIST15-1]
MTIGIILILSTVAFEGLAITTIAPTLAHSLQGIHLYGWIFSTFLLFQLIGTMVIGKQIDRHGVIASVLVSCSIFVIGIIIAALSFHMYMLIAGRALQGFGAGSLVTCVYYIVTVRYPDSLRTSILAAFSAAYVLPALIGPYVAGLISINLSWRFVFWLVLPLIVLALCMTLPSFRSIKITGFGVGLATPTIGAVALQLAEEGKEGEVSATLQFIDSFSIAVSIGISGALVALSESLQLGIFTGVMMALVLQLCFVVLSFVTSFRITMKAHSIVQSHSSM